MRTGFTFGSGGGDPRNGHCRTTRALAGGGQGEPPSLCWSGLLRDDTASPGPPRRCWGEAGESLGDEGLEATTGTDGPGGQSAAGLLISARGSGRRRPVAFKSGAAASPAPSRPIPVRPVPSRPVPCRQESRAMLHWGYDEHNGREEGPGRRGGQRGSAGSTCRRCARQPSALGRAG